MTDDENVVETFETETTVAAAPPVAATEPKLVELARDPKNGGHGAHRVLVPADEIGDWLAVGWYRA